ncbi:hypothetical protein BJY01DRAFT_249386 [Aspergillus pseudoustus]|uniref:ABM domain-containing protein n=1 Tax=Aspergillus pseudoustus TaxID=1810923 RepID=A0ABR4JNX6_9EURO
MDFQVPDGEFVIYGTLTAAPNQESQVADMIRQISTQVKAHKGTLYYCITQDPENPRQFHLFERYADKAGFVEHGELPLVKELFFSSVVEDIKPIFIEVGKEL